MLLPYITHSLTHSPLSFLGLLSSHFQKLQISDQMFTLSSFPLTSFTSSSQLLFVPLVISLHSRPLQGASSPFIVPFHRRYSSLLIQGTHPTKSSSSLTPTPAEIPSSPITPLVFYFSPPVYERLVSTIYTCITHDVKIGLSA